MTLKEIIIRIDNQAIYFNPNFSISIQKSNLPIDSLRFRTVEEIYWKVELLNYLEETKCWNLRVLDYKVLDLSIFKRQKPRKAIENVCFEKLDWLNLEPQLSSYQVIKLQQLIYNYEPLVKDNYKPEVKFSQSKYAIPELTDIPIPKVETKPSGPRIELLKFIFSVSFKEATFLDGFVSFKRHVQKLQDKIEIKIQNDHIIEEFDNIKSWFSKRFKSKIFKVEASITIIDGQLSEVHATSPEIELITPELIDSVKYDRTISLAKPPRVTHDNRSLYSLDDIFEQIDPDLRQGNIFNQTESEIIKSLTEKEYVRNRKQLEFLSDKKQSANSKIYFTLNPLFGFVFLIETRKKYHFTWELLKSHATYLWTINKTNDQIESQYSIIEKYINEIIVIGREEYRKKHLNNYTTEGFAFKAIEHQDILTNPAPGFDKWKNKLEEILDNE